MHLYAFHVFEDYEVSSSCMLLPHLQDERGGIRQEATEDTALISFG